MRTDVDITLVANETGLGGAPSFYVFDGTSLTSTAGIYLALPTRVFTR